MHLIWLKKRKKKKCPAAFFDYAEWCAVCVSTFFFQEEEADG
jgi:hypothetical protein